MMIIIIIIIIIINVTLTAVTISSLISSLASYHNSPFESPPRNKLPLINFFVIL
jgi:hypothetical protein